MQPTYISISNLFGSQTRHSVPLFQRPYVWTQEDQWEPLWEDISGLLERIELREEEAHVASHFLGTIVLEQTSNPTGSLPRREVIDGQQRLTTLQLVLKAAEHALEAAEARIDVEVLELEEGSTALVDAENTKKTLGIARRQISTLTENPAFSEEEERYKVWPTNEDRSQFQSVMDCVVSEAPESTASRMASAYWYFRIVFEEYLAGPDVAEQAKRFSTALRDYLKVIVLDLDPSDEPQAIFETLNAHGTPLLPADLMKNWLLWEAARQKTDANTLYTDHWRPFDREHEYWRERVGTGHAARARVDTFLQNWLTMETAEAVPAKHLYDRFLRYARKQKDQSDNGQIDLEALMASIRHFADLYERIDRPRGEGRFNRFLERLKVLDIIVFHPLLLVIMDRLDDDEKKLAEVAEVLESFLIRRMICNYQTRGYGTLALRLLDKLKTSDDLKSIPSILTRELITEEDAKDSWSCPQDKEFRESWQTRRFYKSLRRDRVLMILRALEEYAQTASNLAEPIMAFDWSKVQIEHIMPQKWEKHWPLTEGVSDEDRDHLVHGIGNLTLVSEKLNPSMSNAPWLASETTPKSKKEALRQHSRLDLNKRLLDSAGEDWNEVKISERAEELFDIALKVWSI